MKNKEELGRKSCNLKKSKAGGKRAGSGRKKRGCAMKPVQVPEKLSEQIKVACEAIAIEMCPQDEQRCRYTEDERIAALKTVKSHISNALEELERRVIRKREEEMNKRQYHFDF